MNWSPESVLRVLDDCAGTFTLPMLDNGYNYLAAARLSVFHAEAAWALVIETFEFSPRAGNPDVCVHTFASHLRNRGRVEDFVSSEAHRNFQLANPYNETHLVFPFDDEDWIDPDTESVTPTTTQISIRGQSIVVPNPAEYQLAGVELEEPPSVRVFELCRAIAHSRRDLVLATPHERRHNVPDNMVQILQLEDWHHPDLSDDEIPSKCETFQQLARVALTGNAAAYEPTRNGNTHWRNWPLGGTL